MNEYSFESPYGLDLVSVNVTANPRVAVVVVEHAGTICKFTFENPSPIASLAGLFEELEQIRIADRNFYGAQLEFGRYDVQIWDEDNPYACFDCDSYRIEGFDAQHSTGVAQVG